MGIGKIKGCPICKGKDFGTRDNKVNIKMPDSWETKRRSRHFDIDSCMVPEIKELWDNGVRTIECCCGHGHKLGYIAVDELSQKKMIDLGYNQYPDHVEYRPDLFVPRGVEYTRDLQSKIEKLESQLLEMAEDYSFIYSQLGYLASTHNEIHMSKSNLKAEQIIKELSND